LPIKQGIAVTGSVNQQGDVQAIGGVNLKIECLAFLLTLATEPHPVEPWPQAEAFGADSGWRNLP
jgi:predicted ATP-dependent protease